MNLAFTFSVTMVCLLHLCLSLTILPLSQATKRFGLGERKAEYNFLCEIIRGVEVIHSFANHALSIGDQKDKGDVRQESICKFCAIMSPKQPMCTIYGNCKERTDICFGYPFVWIEQLRPPTCEYIIHLCRT